MNRNPIPLSEARQNLTHIVATVTSKGGEPVLISVRGKPTVAIISAEEYQDYLKAKYREEFRSIFDELDELNKSLVNK